MLLVPHREQGMDTSALPADHRTRQGHHARQVEPVRDKLKRLAGRGCLHRTPAGRFTNVPLLSA
ncbi:hypothetical protein AB0I68_35085 [Streptomyces sp. NPDC050448]|uniref:hypothetical protein n=1 Tax=Streptomyces sp. NPDC050448 TaxID=3155404 RepID=UPI00343EC6D0